MKIVTVCGMGLGTSLMLKMTVEKAAKVLGIDASVEACDIGIITGMQADLIVTSSEFAGKIQHPVAKVVSVKNVFNLEEVTALLKGL